MSSPAPASCLTVDDYLAGEAISPIKHEYVAGEVFAMAGASEQHATIAGNVFALLRAYVRGGSCRVYIADMKLRVERADAFFYPDCFVTCDPADADQVTAKRNATVVIEVLSDSTEAYDRGAKFAAYRKLPALEEYVLIDSRERSVEVFRRHPEGWILHPLSEGEPLRIDSLDFECDQNAVYEDVRFPDPGEAAARESVAPD